MDRFFLFGFVFFILSFCSLQPCDHLLGRADLLTLLGAIFPGVLITRLP